MSLGEGTRCRWAPIKVVKLGAPPAGAQASPFLSSPRWIRALRVSKFFSCTLPFIRGEGNTTTDTLKKAKNDPSNLPDSAEAWVSHAGDDLDADIGRWHGLLVDLVRLLAALVDDHLVVLAAKHLLRL